MNLEAIRLVDELAAPPPLRVALTTPNPANAVVTHLVSDLQLTPLFGMAGVFITGSNVWRPALGLPTVIDSDVDIMLIGTSADALVELCVSVIEKLSLADSSYPTAPSMTDDRDAAILPGRKYVAPSGRVVDIWGMERLHQALQQYPEHSHASSRMAWDCEHGCLIMFPNTAHTSQPLLPETAFDPVPGVTW
jgi:hypothetical protein